MNLLFFTVELERSRPRTRALGDRSRNESPLRKRSFRWILLATAALLCAAAVGWVLAGGGGPFVNDVLDWLPIDTASASAGGGGKARLEITSLPNNATVLVDGHQKGKTPLSLAVIKGAHTLMLTHPAAVDTRRQLDVTADMDVIVSMWRRRPDAMPLKPAYPGASIRGAAFLADGRLTLAMALPGPAGNQADGMMNEAWILDPTSGSLIPFKARSNPRAAIVAVSPDGTNLAYAQPQQSDTRPTTTRPRLTEALVAGAGGSPAVKAFTLPAVNVNPASGSATTNEIEEVHDLAWTPDGRHLLVAVRLVGFAGGYQAAPRSRLLLVDAESTDEQQVAPVELLTLPAEIVAGSYNWDPDGKWVAFLTQATTGPGGQLRRVVRRGHQRRWCRLGVPLCGGPWAAVRCGRSSAGSSCGLVTNAGWTSCLRGTHAEVHGK